MLGISGKTPEELLVNYEKRNYIARLSNSLIALGKTEKGNGTPPFE